MKKMKRLDGKKTSQVTSEQKKTKPYSDPWGMGFKNEKQERKYLYGLLLVICLIWIPPFFLATVDEELFLRYSPLMKGILLSVAILVGGSVLISRLLHHYKNKKLIMFLFCLAVLVRMVIQLMNGEFMFMETI